MEPSTQLSRLNALVSDLYKLEVMITALESCAEIASAMNSRGYMAVARDPLADGHRGHHGQPMGRRQHHRGAGRETRRGPVARPDRLLKSVRNIFRQFPVHSYPDKETRDAVLDANQAALDINIAKEDEA